MARGTVDWRRTHCSACGKRTSKYNARRVNGGTLHQACERAAQQGTK